jgi:YidC/Oxa1 family membrane protein insertase
VDGAASVSKTEAPAPVAASSINAPVAKLSAADLTIENDKVIYQFSQELGGFASIKLRDFKSDNRAEAGFADLLDSPMALQATIEPKNTDPSKDAFQAERKDQSITFFRDAGGFRLSQTFTVPKSGYGLELKISFTNIGTQPAELTSGLLLTESILHKKSPSVLGIIPGTVRERDQLIYNADDSTDWLDIEKFCNDNKEAPRFDGVPVRFAGIDRHYFLTVFQSKAKTSSLRLDHSKGSASGCALSLVNYDRQGTVKPGETVNLDYTFYAGPKELGLLQAQGADLTSAMHLGTFSFIARPLLLVIEGFEKVTRNYGLAIILLTICLKLLFYPLVRASTISMHKMKKLNPQMAAIKEKFKDDRARQQQELMKFMAANKINPMKGCLPVLPQIPVFFAFYQVLQTSISLRHASFGLWIQDLSAMDPYFVTPLLMGVAMFVQQKLTPTSGMDKTQEKILMLMPIMFTVMMLTLPAGLTLYMLTNTVIGIAQQKWLYHRLDRLEPNMR